MLLHEALLSPLPLLFDGKALASRLLMQADDPLRSATRVDTVASYGQLRPVVSVAMDADTDPLAADTDGMTSIDLDQPAAGSAGPRKGSASGDAADDPPGMSGASNNRRASWHSSAAGPCRLRDWLLQIWSCAACICCIIPA